MNSKIKQRLVGALVLIGLVAIFMPIIFHGSNIANKNIAMTATAPKAPNKPKVEIVVAKASNAMQQKQKQLQQTAAQREQGISNIKVAQTTKKLNKDSSKILAPIVDQNQIISSKPKLPVKAHKIHERSKSEKHISKTHRHIANGATVWVVQVASFSDRPNAQRLKKRLEEKGFKCQVQALHEHKKTYYRVLVGPEKNKRQAQSIQKRLEQSVKLKGMVFNLKRSELV